MAAQERGRHPGGWFLLALVMPPVLAFLLLMAVQNRANHILPGTLKTCPRCAESVKKAAPVRRFCGHEFAGSPSASPGSGLWPAAAKSASVSWPADDVPA